MAILKVKGLSKAFGDVYALRDVNVELSKGEIIGILGPNGAGKTTLIHCILGLIAPTKGSIETFGMDLPQSRVEILKRMNFASNYVSLPLSLTLYENLMIYALMYEVPSPAERCDEVLKLFDLINLRKKTTRKLSSGQMMRLSLAKAMINNPEILLLDEPTAGLDLEISLRTRTLLKELRDEKGLSVIYTSHNLQEMEEVSDRIIFLHGGRVIAEGRESDLLNRYGVRSLEEFYFKVLQNGF
jgi:ABC-2 type transport system ATP-binding protein